MGCATSVVKFLVFFFNLIFALAGLAIIIIGVLFRINDKFTSDSDHLAMISAASIVVIVVGVIVFVIAFFGCCGAIRESGCMLTTFAVLLLALFIIQIAIGIYIFIEVKDERGLKKHFADDFRKDMDKFNRDEHITDYINAMQKENQCCGASGPRDYADKGMAVPPSCCIDGDCANSPQREYQDGCSDKVFDYLVKHVKIIAIVALVIALTELIGAIFALCLASSIRNQYRRGVYA